MPTFVTIKYFRRFSGYPSKKYFYDNTRNGISINYYDIVVVLFSGFFHIYSFFDLWSIWNCLI